MCGIAGFYSPGNRNGETLVREMIDTIGYRGPDDRSTCCIDGWALGHARLAVIDPQRGRQPMVSDDGCYTLFFNGEIYNYVELRNQLMAAGRTFKTDSDTEVLLKMYIRYGKDVLEHLNGMFAFVVYNKREKTLFAARDHFGIKPFYFYSRAGLFAFASEIKALFHIPGINPEPDSKSLYEYLTFQFVLKKHTLFNDIYKLEPAHYMIVREGEIIGKKEYWRLNFSVDDTRTEAEYADELLNLLENTVSMQLRSDVPVGLYLSGGLDSSILAVLGAEHLPGKLHCFTGAFRESEQYDESRYARIVVESVKGEGHLIYPEPGDFSTHFEKLVYHMDEPAAGPGLFPQFMVSKLASNKVKVVLGGQGADEIFGGYARYAVAYLEQCLKGAIFETQEEGKYVVTLNSIIENMPLLKTYLPMIKTQFASGLFDSMDMRYYRLIDRSPRLSRLYRPEFLSHRSEPELFEKFLLLFNDTESRSYFNKMTHFDIKTLLPALLQVEDRVSMAASIESRVPYLDRRVTELAARIPPTMKFAGGKTKHMLLRTVRDILPREIAARKDKMGFPTPLNEWLAGPLKEYALDILTGPTTRRRGIMAVENIEDALSETSPYTRDLWGALNLEVWFRTFIDR